MLAVWFDSNAVKMTTAEHDLTKVFWSCICIFTIKPIWPELSFWRRELIQFEHDNINVHGWINWKISDTKEWFQFRRRESVWEHAFCHDHSCKDEETHFRSLVAVSTLHKLECITVIYKWNCKWPYQGMFNSCNIGSVNFVLVLKSIPVLFWTTCRPTWPLREKVSRCSQNIQVPRCFRDANKLYLIHEILNWKWLLV